MSGELESAYILHARDYRDTSLIVDLLTRESGRFSALVKGARAKKSKLRGRLQPFTPLLVAALGKGELKTATTIDFPARAYRLQGSNLMLGLYINELLYRLLARFDPVPEIYEGYERLLANLQKETSDILPVRQFELKLLTALGYGISFEYNAGQGEQISPDNHYRFVVHEGFYPTETFNNQTFTGRELLHIAEGELAEVNSQKLKLITRRSLAALLGDRPLKSRALFQGESGMDENRKNESRESKP